MALAPPPLNPKNRTVIDYVATDPWPRIEAGVRRGPAAAALVKKQHVIKIRVEQAAMAWRNVPAGTPVKENGWLSTRSADPLIIEAVPIPDVENPRLIGFDCWIQGS